MIAVKVSIVLSQRRTYLNHWRSVN